MARKSELVKTYTRADVEKLLGAKVAKIVIRHRAKLVEMLMDIESGAAG